jgi:hypothetical protein
MCGRPRTEKSCDQGHDSLDLEGLLKQTRARSRLTTYMPIISGDTDQEIILGQDAWCEWGNSPGSRANHYDHVHCKKLGYYSSAYHVAYQKHFGRQQFSA